MLCFELVRTDIYVYILYAYVYVWMLIDKSVQYHTNYSDMCLFIKINSN
jgi:hypothetical protein